MEEKHRAGGGGGECSFYAFSFLNPVPYHHGILTCL